MILAQPQRKPSVFIASTGRAAGGEGVATRLRALLTDAVRAEVWNENMILPDEAGNDRVRGEVMANLYKAARYYDFVIVVVGGKEFTSASPGLLRPNPNLVFEMGLFMGALGNSRTQVVLEPALAEKDIDWPSDLTGHFGPAMIALAASDAATLRAQAQAILETIRKADESAGLSLLPSTGTAISYFKNFIQPVAEYLLGDTFQIDDVTYRARETTYTFDIVLPLTLRGAGFTQRAQFKDVNKDQFEERKVNLGRGYPFFVRTGQAPDHLQIVDFATPLASSFEAIQLIIEDEMKSLTAIDYTQGGLTPYQLLEQKEIANFEVTLYKLLQIETRSGKTPASCEFPSRVRLRRQDLSLPLTWE